ncbi:MAG: chromophore lyase CpcT/CpeT [Acidobacteriota bacterium]
MLNRPASNLSTFRFRIGAASTTRLVAGLIVLAFAAQSSATAATQPDESSVAKPPPATPDATLPAATRPSASKPLSTDPAKTTPESDLLSPIAPADAAAEVAALLSGNFTSAEQAKEDKEYRDIHLSVAPAWTDRTDGHWLYVEQAVATALDRPYRQRVYHIVPGPDGTVISEIWLLPGDNARFVGQYKQPKPLEGITPQELKRMEGCEVRLSRIAPHRYQGSTPDRSCKSNREGAVFTTSIVTLSQSGIDSWDRGWDDAGLQVWGAVSGPYKFRR